MLSFSPKISLSKENLKRIVDDRMMEGERVHQRAGRFSIDASGSDDGGWSWGSRCRDGDLNINIVDSAQWESARPNLDLPKIEARTEVSA